MGDEQIKSILSDHKHELTVVTEAWTESKEWWDIRCCECGNVVWGRCESAERAEYILVNREHYCNRCEDAFYDDDEPFYVDHGQWSKDHPAKFGCVHCGRNSFGEKAADMPCDHRLAKTVLRLTQDHTRPTVDTHPPHRVG